MILISTNTSQWKAWASSDIPNNGAEPDEAVPENAPTESAPNDPPPDSNSTVDSGTDDPDLPNRGSLEVRLGNISTAAYIPNNQPFSSGFQAQLDSAGLDYKGQ